MWACKQLLLPHKHRWWTGLLSPLPSLPDLSAPYHGLCARIISWEASRTAKCGRLFQNHLTMVHELGPRVTVISTRAPQYGRRGLTMAPECRSGLLNYAAFAA